MRRQRFQSVWRKRKRQRLKRAHCFRPWLESLEARRLLAAGDFGDAPSPYSVTLAEDGARHTDVGPRLGATRDDEADGVHSAAADADGADEDGVTFGTIMVSQLDATVTVNVQNAPAGARLDAWMDFNHDGSWEGNASTLITHLGGRHGYIIFDRAEYDRALMQMREFLRQQRLLPSE
ncbi:MAG: hypothetical protein CMJ64_23465 [Planctomycetaceae bacterium]|nr:hypothetical protein [Planctomycetaceae bacterium]